MKINLTPHRKGGFLGGFLGILLFAWSPWLMLVGCLVGCVVGMHHQKIWDFAVEDWNKTVKRFIRRNEIITLYKRQIRYSYLRLRVHIRRSGVIMRFIATVFFGTISVVWRVFRWPFKGWTSKFILGRIGAALTAATFMLAGTLWFLADFDITFTGEVGPPVLLAALCWVIVVIMATALPMKPWEHQNYSDVKARRESVAIASSRWGLLKVLRNDLFRQFGVSCLVGPAFATFCAAAIVIGIPLFLIALFGSFVLALGLAILRVTLEHKHWTCFSVTLAITSLSAFFARHQLHGAYLWMIAFINGCCCGFAAEKVHESVSPRIALLLARVKKKDEHGELLNAAMNVMFGAVFNPLKKLAPVLDRVESSFRPFLA